MCKDLDGLKTISERVYELEQKRAKKKKELDVLENEIKELKKEASGYMKKRQKNEISVSGFTVLFTAFTKPSFDKDAFITGEKNGQTLYNKYLRNTPMEKVTIKLAK